MRYWNFLPQDEDGLATVDAETLLDIFDYCGIRLTDDDAQVMIFVNHNISHNLQAVEVLSYGCSCSD